MFRYLPAFRYTSLELNLQPSPSMVLEGKKNKEKMKRWKYQEMFEWWSQLEKCYWRECYLSSNGILFLLSQRDKESKLRRIALLWAEISFVKHFHCRFFLGKEQTNRNIVVICFIDFKRTYWKSPLQHSEILQNARTKLTRSLTLTRTVNIDTDWQTEFLLFLCVLLLITYLRETIVA